MKFKTKKILIIAVVIGIPMLFANFTTRYIKTSGAHAGSTGAPGDLTCQQTGCHANASVHTNMVGTNTFTYPVADSSYVPGQTYTLSLKVEKPGIVKFGFEIQPLKDANNTNIGTWIVTDPARTHEITHTIAGNSRHSLTHTSAGTAATSSGENIWSFKWKAPSTNQGTITFYYATNCTNNNGAATGDGLWLNSFTIHPASSSSISEFLNEDDSKIYFNAMSNEIIFDYNLKINKKITLRLVDALGRIVDMKESSKSIGKNIEKINVDNNIKKGIYFASLMIDGQAITKKIVVQ